MISIFFRQQIFDEISKYLHTDDIIVIHGARQVGKTSSLMYLKKYTPTKRIHNFVH